MAKYTINLDEASTTYAQKMGDCSEFFDIALIEEKKEVWGRLSPEEAEVLALALQKYVERRTKAKAR